VKITEAEATALATGLLCDRGAPPAHAVLQAKVLVDAEMKGHPSHGLQRLPRLIRRIEKGLADPATTGSGQWQSSSFFSVDGARGLGPVVADHAIATAIPRARETGIAIAAIHNANHLGMLAHYVEGIAEAGLIGIALSSSEALVHPFGGTRALLGTNPVAMSIPVEGAAPFVVDLATSIVSMGKVHHYAATGAALEPGWAKDESGQPTIDAGLARAGSLAPFGGAKGYALGLSFELLIAAIAGTPFAPGISGTLDAEHPCNKGDVFIIINAGTDRQNASRFAAYLDAIRHSAPEQPAAPVRVPGDGARDRMTAARLQGFTLDPALHRQLLSLSTQTAQAQP